MRQSSEAKVALDLTLFHQAFVGSTRWDLVMGGSTLMILPVILVFFMAQRFFRSGYRGVPHQGLSIPC